MQLLQHDSEYRSETLSSLIGQLYDLTSRKLDIPPPPSHFPRHPPHPLSIYSGSTDTTSVSSSASALNMPPKKEMHLLPSDGRMAPRLIPKELTPPQLPARAPTQAVSGRAATKKAVEQGGKAGATNGTRPVFGAYRRT